MSADLLGLADVARLCGVPRGTAKAWRSRGVLPEPAHVVSGRPVWERATVERWWTEWSATRSGPGRPRAAKSP